MNHQDFIDLASLYVLGALEERDSDLIEDCAESTEELQNELKSLQNLALAIPYGIEQYTLPLGLKERVLQKINSDHPIEPPIEMVNSPEPNLSELFSFQVKARQINWVPHPHGIDGVSISPLFIDRINRKFSGLVRCDVGAIYPTHRHADAEEILILEGDLIIDGESFGAGDYIYSAPNSLHTPIGNQEGCLFFVKTSLDDSFMP